MGSNWTDETAILRDLSLAQGQWVPGGIDAVGAGEKPPSLVIAEETEEDYYRHWTTEGDFSTGPDLSLIKKMLEMVHNELENGDSCPAPAAQIEITKINSISLPMLRKPQLKKSNKIREKLVKPPHSRNVAIASILASKQIAAAPEIPLKLSKPDDFIKTKEQCSSKEENEAKERKQESVKKVNHWLNVQNMSNMFKKKSPSKASNVTQNMSNIVKNKSPSIASGETQNVSGVQSNRRKKQVSSPCGDQYKPSSWAGEYYQMCVKRSQMQQLIKESIWDRAEKMMKDIDDHRAEEIRKQQEVNAVLAAVLETTEAEIISREISIIEDNGNHDEREHDTRGLTVIEKIELPQHRHQLTGPCIVCKVLIKKPLENTTDAIEVKEEEYITNESEPSSPEVFHATQSDRSNETYSIGNDSDDNAEMYSLVRGAFVENLSNIDTTELNSILGKHGSLEELDVIA